MRYVSAWVAALVAGSLGSASILTSFAPVGTVEVNLTVDWQVNPKPISPTFVGASISAANNGNGLSTRDGVSSAAIAGTAQLRLKMLRFPDDISQSYHWKGASAAGQLTTAGFYFLARESEIGHKMITVNMVTGTLQETRDWAAYANLPASTLDGQLRQADGVPEPMGIEYWLLGENIRDYKERFPNADRYVDAAISNASVIKGVSPLLKVGLWIDDGTSDEGRQWNLDLTNYLVARDSGQGLNPQDRKIDFLAVRVRVEVPNRPLTDGALFPSLNAFAAKTAEDVVARAEQVTNSLRVPLPVAVYDYGIEFAQEGWNQDKADSLGAALALAGMVNVFVHHEAIFTALYKGLNAKGYSAILKVPTIFDVPPAARFTLNPFGEILATYGQYLEGQALTFTYVGAGASPARAFFQAPQVGRIPPAVAVPLLSVASSLDQPGRQMLLYVASRSIHDRVVVHLAVEHTSPFEVNGTVLTGSISADTLSTDSYTGLARVTTSGSERRLDTGTPVGDRYTFDLVVEPNAFDTFVFTLTQPGA
jgi:hypothetical protein